MVQVVRRAEQQQSPNRTIRFEGHDHGSAVSFFLVDAEPGQGPALHVHPYPETWIVRSGTAEFTAGSEKLTAGPGDIVVVGADTPHRFLNIGTERLEIVCIHASDRIIQDWVEPGVEHTGQSNAA